MNKNVKYIVAIVILLGVNLLLFYSDGLAGSSSFNDKLFAVSDTSQVSAIEISGKSEVSIARSGAEWRVNDTFSVDQNFLNIFFTIMDKVRVKRPVGQLETNNGGTLTIRFIDGTSNSFQFASDGIGTRSYFITDEEAYQVEVPGYRDNVVNILELNEDQWRNRMVFDGSWRTIQNLNLKSDKEEVNIRFNNQFFVVDGVSAIDSSAVVDYLNQFQFLQANEMVSEGRFPELDSLKSTRPQAVLTLDDIKSEDQTVFTIYPSLPNQNYHLVIKNNGERMVFDSRRIRSILKSRADFQAK